MKVIILGGSGELGTILSRAFHRAGQEVVAISRGAVQTPWRSLQWDAATHRRLERRAGWRGCGHQSCRAQRQL